jgi:hypothetical protein
LELKSKLELESKLESESELELESWSWRDGAGELEMES